MQGSTSSALDRAAIAFLTLASLAYYGWWKPEFLLLMEASILFNFATGTAIGRRTGTPAESDGGGRRHDVGP